MRSGWASVESLEENEHLSLGLRDLGLGVRDLSDGRGELKNCCGEVRLGLGEFGDGGFGGGLGKEEERR